MNLNIIHNKGITGDELKVIGEIDAYTAPELKDLLLDLTKQPGNTITIDFGETTYMDSTGIGVIVAAYKSSKVNHADMVVKGLTPRVKRLFDITGLSDIVRIEPAKEEI